MNMKIIANTIVVYNCFCNVCSNCEKNLKKGMLHIFLVQ